MCVQIIQSRRCLGIAFFYAPFFFDFLWSAQKNAVPLWHNNWGYIETETNGNNRNKGRQKQQERVLVIINNKERYSRTDPYS